MCRGLILSASASALAVAARSSFASAFAHQVVEPRVERGFFGGLAQGLGREGIVFLVQRHLGRGEISLDITRCLLGDDIVALVQHLPCISPAQQEEPPDRDQAFRRRVPPGRVLDQARDGIELGCGLPSMTALAIDLTRQKTQ